MAEINNSLALGVKADAPDIGKTLLQVGQINSLRANTAKTQQDVDYNNLLQSQDPNGRRPQERNTLDEATTKELGIQGQIGNQMQQAKTTEDRLQAIQASEDAGKPVSPKMKQHLLEIPLSQFQQYGKNMQAGGMAPANSGIIATSNQSATGGAKLGGIDGPPGYKGPLDAPPGSPVIKGAAPGPEPRVTLQDREQEGAAEAQNNAKIYNDIQSQATAAQPKKVALNQILLDAQRVRTGAGAEREQNARKWMMAVGDTFPILKGFTDRYKDSTTAFDSLDKNAGLVARDAMKGVGGTAASELQAISSTLANHTTSNGGIEVNARQLYGLESANQGKLNAAELYKGQYGTMKGFTGWYQKNAGPAAWVFDALPASEKKIIVDDLNKTDRGKEIKTSLVRQIDFIRKNNLHQGVE